MKSRFSSALASLFLFISCAGEDASAVAPQLPITDNGDGTFSYGKTKLKKDPDGVYYVDGASNAPPPRNVNGVTILTPAEAKKLKDKQAKQSGLKKVVDTAEKAPKRKKSIQVVDAPATQKATEPEAAKIDPEEEFRKANPLLYNQEREEARQRARSQLQAAASQTLTSKVDSTTNKSPDPILPPQYLDLQQRAEEGDLESQYQLGVALKNGLGGERDVDKARYWLEKAAGQGHIKARLVLNSRW